MTTATNDDGTWHFMAGVNDPFIMAVVTTHLSITAVLNTDTMITAVLITDTITAVLNTDTMIMAVLTTDTMLIIKGVIMTQLEVGHNKMETIFTIL